MKEARYLRELRVLRLRIDKEIEFLSEQKPEEYYIAQELLQAVDFTVERIRGIDNCQPKPVIRMVLSKELYDRGYSFEQISKLIDVTEGTVRNYMCKYNEKTSFDYMAKDIAKKISSKSIQISSYAS